MGRAVGPRVVRYGWARSMEKAGGSLPIVRPRCSAPVWLPQLTLPASCLPAPDVRSAAWCLACSRAKQARGTRVSCMLTRAQVPWAATPASNASLDMPGRRSAEGSVEEEDRGPRGEKHQQRVAHVGKSAAAARAGWSVGRELEASSSAASGMHRRCQPALSHPALCIQRQACAQMRRGRARPLERPHQRPSMTASCQSLKGCRATATTRNTAVVRAVSIFCSSRWRKPSASKASGPTQSLSDASDKKRSAWRR